MPAVEVLRTEHSWIQKTPDVCGGEACIRETRIPVWSVIAAWRRGATEEQLRDYFVTSLTAADIEVARAYYARHPEEIDEDIRANEDA